MRFLVITHVSHILEDNKWFAYAPYVREMNLWFKHVDQVEIIAPKSQQNKSSIDLNYEHPNLEFNEIPAIEFTTLLSSLVSFFKLPLILFRIFMGCKRADHIHLRCPGNIGLLGTFVQILFPKKIKTAKYAGNWDPKSKQPLSYRIQKRLLSNTFLSKNLAILVYGEWKNQSKNIKPFFTASYFQNENKGLIKKKFASPFKILFVGGLVVGKQPLFAIELIYGLRELGLGVSLDFYGDGVLRKELIEYQEKNELLDIVKIHGNVDKETLKKEYESAHFILLPSKSEGWPKALAEGMFFGCIPIATNVSCVSWMLDEGRRGILISDKIKEAINQVSDCIRNGNLEAMSIASQQWSQQYTLDRFEKEIIKLLEKQ